MTDYIIKPDMNNFDDPLFVWYLIFSNMSQHFSSILDIILPYTSEPSIDGASGNMTVKKDADRIYNFIFRVTFGYVSEAQKSIRQFIKSSDYIRMIELIPKGHSESFREIERQWKEHNSNNEWKYLSELRNSVFHFASDPDDKDEYKTRFENFVNEISANPTLKMMISDYKINDREYRQDTFCDTLWDLNITRGYNLIVNSLTPYSEGYVQDVMKRIAHSLDLCYRFIFLIRDFLQQYFMHIGIITEEKNNK